MPTGKLKMTISGGSFDFAGEISSDTASRLMGIVMGLNGGQPVNLSSEPVKQAHHLYGHRNPSTGNYAILKDIFMKNRDKLEKLSFRKQAKFLFDATGMTISSMTCRDWLYASAASKPAHAPAAGPVSAPHHGPFGKAVGAKERRLALYRHVMEGRSFILGFNDFRRASWTFHCNVDGSAKKFFLRQLKKDGFQIEGSTPIRVFKPEAREAALAAYREWCKVRHPIKLPAVKPVESVPVAAQPPGSHIVIPAVSGVSFSSKVEAVVLTISKSVPQFTVMDILQSLKSKPFNSSNPAYLAVFNALRGLENRNIVDRFTFNQGGSKRTFYSLHGSNPKAGTSVESDDMPIDASDDCLKAIIEHNNVSFKWEAICRERNVHGAYFERFSAKALFDWMFRHTDYISSLTCRNVRPMGSGDYRYIKVGA
jgi:hypothetical protein